MEGAYTFTCQLCRARLTLVGNLEAAESAVWAGGRGFLVPPHLQASVFDHTNVDESFIVLDGKRQGPLAGAAAPHPGLPPHQPHQPPSQQLLQQPAPAPPKLPAPQQQLQAQGASPPSQQQGLGTQLPPPQLGPQQQLLQPPPHPHAHGHHQLQQRGLEESFVVLGAASVLRPNPALHHHHYHHPGVSPLHLQALQQQQLQQQQQQQQQGGTAATGPSQAAGAGAGAPPPQQQQAAGLPPGQSPPSQRQQAPSPPTHHPPYPPPHPTYLQPNVTSTASPPQPSPLAGPRRGGGGAPQGSGTADAEGVYGNPTGSAGGGGGSTGGGGGGDRSGGGGGGPPGSGLDSKLQALAQLFELASTNTQVDHPLCMDCVGQLKEEMETQIAEAEREIAAYSSCLASLEGAGAAAGAGAGGGDGGPGQQRQRNAGGSALDTAAAASASEEEYILEEISRLEQERDQERARAEVLESELSGLVSELASLSAASADLASLEERYWHDADDFELLLRAHTDERGALLAKIDRAGQRLQLLKNTSVLYDAFKIWHDGPFGTISGFRLGRTPEVAVEWDEINAAWGQAVLLLHTMAQMCKLQFSQHRLLPMGSHPRVADKRATYDLFGPVSKLWSANYDRAMVAYLSCLKEFGEHARRKDAADGKPVQFNFPFPIEVDKVNNHTIKLTLNKDVRWTKALKFMLANLKIALQWCVKQDQAGEVPQLAQLAQEGPQTLPEH